MWIVSSDTVFAEALQIALRTAGIKAEILPALPIEPEKSDCWIVDLDAVPSVTSLPADAITFSRSPIRGAKLVRPFLFRELIALVQSRLGVSPEPAKTASTSTAPFLKLAPDGVILQGDYIALSPAEHALLALLLEASGECVPSERIDALWQEKGGNTTAVYIRYLRKKIDEPTGLRLIRTVRGRGYCLCLPR